MPSPPAKRRTHPAVAGFDRAAGAYERGRPEYPADAVRSLARSLGLGPRRTVVELASGTGKFTRALTRTGAAIVPIEPTRGMRIEFARQLPDLPAIDGIAEAIPLPDAFADAVVVAQAFHWFRPRRALREIHRVLRPGGGLGLVWNHRDESVPWVRALTDIIDRYGWNVPRTRQVRWRRVFERGGVGFAPLRRRSFRFVQRLDRSTIVDRFLSVSCIALLPRSEQRRVARKIREVIARDPATRGRARIGLPYRTDVYWTRARASQPGAPRRRPRRATEQHPGTSER